MTICSSQTNLILSVCGAPCFLIALISFLTFHTIPCIHTVLLKEEKIMLLEGMFSYGWSNDKYLMIQFIFCHLLHLKTF